MRYRGRQCRVFQPGPRRSSPSMSNPSVRSAVMPATSGYPTRSRRCRTTEICVCRMPVSPPATSPPCPRPAYAPDLVAPPGPEYQHPPAPNCSTIHCNAGHGSDAACVAVVMISRIARSRRATPQCQPSGAGSGPRRSRRRCRLGITWSRPACRASWPPLCNARGESPGIGRP